MNNSGESIPPHSVLRITNWSIEDNEILYTVTKPDATYRWQYLVSGPFAIGEEDGDEGLATFLSSGGPVYYNTGTPAYGQRWGPTPSQWYLTQHAPGFHVQGAKTTTFNSKNLLVAVQIPPGEVRVKNDDGSGSFAAAATGRTFGIYGGTAGTTDTGLEVTINNGSTVAWATDKYGWATADAGGAIWGAPHQT
jgi:hypothetical protein